MATFTHLHVASAFSAHHGTSRPETLAQAAAASGADIAALTDRDGLYGVVRHVRTCLQAGISPAVGVNLEVRQRGNAPASPEPCEVTILAHGHNAGAGWAGLARLVSSAHAPKRGARRVAHGTANRPAWITPSRPPMFLRGEDGPYGTVLLGPTSDVGRAVLAGDRKGAKALLLAWEERLPGGVAVEIVCHETRPGSVASLRHAADMLGLAHAARMPAVLTNAVRYLTPDDAVTGDVLDSAAHLLPLGDFPPQPNGQAWLKPAEEMHALARRIVEFAGLRRDTVIDLLAATEELAERCRLDPVGDLRWRQPKVPELSVLGITDAPERVLRERCEAALYERFGHLSGTALARVRDRLDMELGTIGGFGFDTYFLAVADVVSLIRDMDVRVQARGSGAGSLVNYLLRISNVDPIEHDLLFERFLGKARSTLPDIDIDVESARRHDVYQAIFDRYGHHRVTLLSMQNRYRARGAARDAGLALGLSPERIDQIAKSLWRFSASEFREVLSSKPELRDVAELVENEPQVSMLVDLTERLDRLPRHISMHPCGVILGDDSLLSTTPTQPSGIGLPMSQFDKDDIDDMGLLKLDVLGVRMQSVLAYATHEIERVNGPRAALEGGLPIDAPYVSATGRVELDAVPHDDEPTFEAIRTTHTLGMFQIESPGQRELIGKMQPDRYSDLIADISLFRPGPMKGNMVIPFIETKHGFQRPDYLHPRFKGFLQDAYGVVIYHEHVLRILHECMGVSLAEADELRRLMERDGESIEEAFREQTAKRKDARGRRIFSDADIERIWGTLKGFGSFGFCKAHGAAFALPTYQTAWLKTHYPVEFLAGIFEHDPGMYPLRLLMAEARRIGIPLLPLDVNASSDHYRVERVSDAVKGIRFSLTSVKGISDAEVARILEGQPYESILDFYRRASPSRALMQRLASVGALDSLARPLAPLTQAPDGSRAPGVSASEANQPGGGTAVRGSVIAFVRQLTAKPRHRDEEHPDQVELFHDSLMLDPEAPVPSPQELTSAELDTLATETSGHVIEHYRPMLDEMGVVPAADLLSLRNNSQVLVAGIRVATQTPPMRSGKRVVFISLDDGSGCSDSTFFEDAQEQAGPLLFGTTLMVIQGRTRRTGERGISLQAENAWDLKAMWNEWQRLRAQRIS